MKDNNHRRILRFNLNIFTLKIRMVSLLYHLMDRFPLKFQGPFRAEFEAYPSFDCIDSLMFLRINKF